MARTLQDAKLDTRAARLRLKKRREPYWRSISEGLAVGYRKGAKGGTWIARHYSMEHGRRFHSIGTVDDVADADGAHVLSFTQAQEAARKWFAHVARRDRGEVRNGPYTVRESVEEYLAWLQAHRKTGYDARHRVRTHIVPHLGARPDRHCGRHLSHGSRVRRPLRGRTASGGCGWCRSWPTRHVLFRRRATETGGSRAPV